jgi:hypothetical protein
MRVDFLPLAKSELDEVVAYYDGQRAGLGEEFADEVRRTLGRIVNWPNAWPKLSPE